FVPRQTVHPLLGERAGVRGTDASERQECFSNCIVRDKCRAPGVACLGLAMALLALKSLCAPAAELNYERHIITFPTNLTSFVRQEISSRFIDLDGDKLADLLALSMAENRLWIYRQRATGFASVPDQTLNLPEGTAWVGVRDIDPSP